MIELVECSCRREVGEFVEIVEVLFPAIAPLALEIEHVGRAVHGHEDRVAPTHGDGALGVAGVHGVFGGYLGNKLHELGAIDPHPVAIDLCPRLPPQGDRFVIAELDAYFLENLRRIRRG